MPRVSGIDIPEEKRTVVSLTYIFGVGRKNVVDIIKQANVNPDKRAKELTQEEISRLQRVLDRFNVEGNLREQVRENIEHLKRIGTYRGLRHTAGLPVRGQRTRVNARTKRGRRKTVGALKKEEAVKMEAAKA